MEYTKHFLETKDNHSLCLVEMLPNAEEVKIKRPILFIHGAIESGRVFYNDKGLGIAPFLSSLGFPCYILDMRGRGYSRPSLNSESSFSQREIFNYDIPDAINFIKKKHNREINVVTHSWGGVLINSFLLRHIDHSKMIKSIVHLAAKRRVGVINLHRIFHIDIIWLLFGSFMIALKGYLPAGLIGPDGESRGTLRDSQKWVYSKKWKDEEFDYHEQVKKIKLPRSLYLTGARDLSMGHYKDVCEFALESGHTLNDVELLSKENGNKEDYDHLSILLSKKAPDDHFERIYEFLNEEFED